MAKNSLVCTLYDGDYHWGVGALINSLYQQDFRGLVCVGYRDALPQWAIQRGQPDANGGCRFSLDKFEVSFSPVGTARHLANAKPDFMLDQWRKSAGSFDYLFFFDADIFISSPWTFFESWADVGVALVADGNSPMPPSHPVRAMWRRYFEPIGFKFLQRNDYHYNSGFLGLKCDHIWVVEQWSKILAKMEDDVDLSLPITLPGAPAWQRRRTFPFFMPDQDALNIVADLQGVEISVIGPEGMGWKPPGIYMQHACGTSKPWKSKYIRQAVYGHAPSSIDYYFWQHVSSPIAVAAETTVRRVQRRIALARRLARLGAVFNILKPA